MAIFTQNSILKIYPNLVRTCWYLCLFTIALVVLFMNIRCCQPGALPGLDLNPQRYVSATTSFFQTENWEAHG